MKTKIFYIDQKGNNLNLGSLKLGQVKDNEVKIKNHYIGLNFHDTYIINNQKPYIPGYEACGEVVEIGKDVKSIKLGDKVGFVSPIMGAFSEFVNVDSKYVIKIPDFLDLKFAAASMMKGLCAHYLVKRVFYLVPGNYVAIYSVGGGVGHILAQIAKNSDARVIGLVGDDKKIDFAYQQGCDIVQNYKKGDISGKILEYTQGKGVDVIYDSVGTSTFEKSLSIAADFGLIVSYGQSCGEIPQLSLEQLEKKSLFITKPSVFKYKETKMELVLTFAEIFEMIRNNKIKLSIYKEYEFEQIPDAFNDLKSGKTLGSLVVKL